MKMHRSGFTVLELLIVIGIIAVLVGILLPVLAGARRVAMRMICSNNLRQMGAAIAVYSHDYNDTMPYELDKGNRYQGPWLLIGQSSGGDSNFDFDGGYLREIKTFYCPEDGHNEAPTTLEEYGDNRSNSVRISYEYTQWALRYELWRSSTLAVKLEQLGSAHPVMHDLLGGARANATAADAWAVPMANHRGTGGFVQYGDGHVTWRQTDDWSGIYVPHVWSSLPK